MIFEEAYKKLFGSITRFCFCLCNKDQYLAEEATVKAFDVLKRKWEELPSYDEVFIRCFLAGTARYTSLEVKREYSSNVISLDEEWCIAVVEREQYMSGGNHNEVLEAQKYEDYIEAIEKTLKGKDLAVFHGIVVEKRTLRRLSEELKDSENALRVRWSRLQKKLEPMVREMIK